MTAEVAVLNRSAVALAADSAVTLSGLDTTAKVDKIFQNENKLFELSKHHPMGIMLYNSTNYFGIPWEVIIKDFRNELGGKSFGHVNKWVEEFRNYISQHPIFTPSKERQREFVVSLLFGELGEVIAEWSKRSERLFFQKQTKAIRAQYPELMKTVIRRRIRLFEAEPYYKGFNEGKADDVLSLYKAEFFEAKDDCFGRVALDREHDDLLLRLATHVLTRARPNWFTTGLVFAGFGSKELFPSLSCIEIGGTLGGELRWIQKRQADIDRSASTAEIIPFAQRDAVDRLLFGRSSRYEAQIVKHFSEALRQIGGGSWSN